MIDKFVWGYAEFYLEEGSFPAALIYGFVVPAMLMVGLYVVELTIAFHFWVFTGHARYVIDEIIQTRYPVFVAFWLYIVYVMYLGWVAFLLRDVQR